MTPERWKQLAEIFDAAIELMPQERESYLSTVCKDDPELRQQVELLLQQDSKKTPDFRALVQTEAASFSNISFVGESIGPYKILEEIGSGGIGQVFLAEDSRLKRRVALKCLPQFFEEQRFNRYQREARAASAINHPNIITVYEVFQHSGYYFIVTEFVEGRTISQKLEGKPISPPEIVDIALQVCDALAEAHRLGIIHRDIKSSNIMVTHRGVVKVLDFGLAKLEGRAAALFQEPPELKTATGIIMGTVQYMSPEQALGKEVDQRTDIFSFGIVMYEMATGKLPFVGENTFETLQRIVHQPPQASIRDVNANIPWELARIIGKSLEKDPDRRQQSVMEIAIDLRNLKRDTESGKTSPIKQKFLYQMATHKIWIVVAAILVLTGIIFLQFPKRTSQNAFSNATYQQLTNLPGEELFPSLSPDGESFLYSAGGDIYLQRIGGSKATNLTSNSPRFESQASFSPDGKQIAFRSTGSGGGIFVMNATGESFHRITELGFNPQWSPDGKEIVFATEGVQEPYDRLAETSRLWIVRLDTNEKRLIETGDAVQPSWSPHGDRIAYWGRRKGGSRDIWTVSRSGGNPVAITDDEYVDWNPVWSPDGQHLMFASDRSGSMNLWSVAIDERTGESKGPPIPLTTPSLYSEHIGFSQDGRRLIYAQSNFNTNLKKIEFDSTRGMIIGDASWLTEGSRLIHNPSVSPDGERIAFDTSGGSQEDIFTMRKDGSDLFRLTDDLHRDRRPVWSPDGKKIAFFSDRSGQYDIWTIRLDTGELQRLSFGDRGIVYPTWSPDGTKISFCYLGGHTNLITLNKSWRDQKPQPLPPLQNQQDWFIGVTWSPDSRKIAGWIGRNDGPHGGITVYDLDTHRYNKISDFGVYPVWLNDGRRVLFVDSRNVFLADTETGETRKIYSEASDDIEQCILSPDSRSIYCSVAKTEADIWLASFK